MFHFDLGDIEMFKPLPRWMRWLFAGIVVSLVAGSVWSMIQ